MLNSKNSVAFLVVNETLILYCGNIVLIDSIIATVKHNL
jgi:hypothetical protein